MSDEAEEAARRLLEIEKGIRPTPEPGTAMNCAFVVARAYLSLRAATVEECLAAVKASAWKHVGDDSYSRGLDRGAVHQLLECVKAIRSLSPAGKGET
jgi:hypothetical protein